MKKSDHQWIQNVLDGQCDEDQFRAFQQRLREDHEFAQLYREYALMQHALYEEFEGRAMIGARQLAPRRTASMRWIGWSAAAAIIIACVMFSQRERVDEKPQRMAISVFSDDAQWLINGNVAAHEHEVKLAKGATVQLLLGQARFSIDGIVHSVIDAPAEWTYDDEMKIRWHRGVGRFRVEDAVQGFTVQTETMSVVDLGTEFGVSSKPGAETEVHVIEGLVSVNAASASEEKTLVGGEAVRLDHSRKWEKIPLQMKPISERREDFVMLVDEDFSVIAQDDVLANRKANQSDDRWRLARGEARLQKGRVEGRNFEAFLPIKIADATAQSGVLLVTMAVENPHVGAYHTQGWAGLSLYRDGEEVVFFGDGFGSEKTWSLDVKQQLPLVLPTHAVTDARTVTLRYDAASGDVSLHHGGLPLGPAFCESKIAAGIHFDEVRLSASEDAALAVRSLQIRAGGETR